MSDCVYCGKPAGFLHKWHQECRDLHETATQKILQFFNEVIGSEIEPQKFSSLAKEIADTHCISATEFRDLSIQGMALAIDLALSGSGLSDRDNTRIADLCGALGLSGNDLGTAGMRLAKAELLRRLDDKTLPTNIHFDDLPIILAKDESQIWLFRNVDYLAMHKHTSYVGASNGISIRVMKGVYYRTGAYHGHPIETQSLSLEGRGFLVIGNQNVYFSSPTKTIRLSIKKIISITPYSDGVGIAAGGTVMAPYVFKLDDPSFCADVIARLEAMS